MAFKDHFQVKAGKALDLSKVSTGPIGPLTDKVKAQEQTAKNLARIAELQELMYAEHKHSLLIVLQAMDAGGKDGAVNVIGGAMNPQGVNVVSFKVPSAVEKDHDYLWRIHQETPRKGYATIFNRSHYEEVLVVRVHNFVPKDVWKERYDEINNFEKVLNKSGTGILKFYLHIDKDEQLKRFKERIDDPSKNWKLSDSDFPERELWDDYRAAYEDALTKCSTEKAPWFIVPANKKWFRDLVISQIVVDHLESLKMKYPAPTVDVAALRAKYYPEPASPALATAPKPAVK